MTFNEYIVFRVRVPPQLLRGMKTNEEDTTGHEDMGKDITSVAKVSPPA